jgi:hypothetical protein
VAVVISYRPEAVDAAASRIADAIIARFGDDFVRESGPLDEYDVLIVVIESGWMVALDEPWGVPVRTQIASALKAGIRVIPVLLTGAAIPDMEQLPEDLRPLVFRNAVRISSGWRFRAGTNLLVRSIWQSELMRYSKISERGNKIGDPIPGVALDFLNPVTRRAFDEALGDSLGKDRPTEVEDWLGALLDEPGQDIDVLLSSLDISKKALQNELTLIWYHFRPDKAYKDKLTKISESLFSWARESWLIASLEFHDERIRSSHLLYALARNRSLAPRLNGCVVFEDLFSLVLGLDKAQHHVIVAQSTESFTDEIEGTGAVTTL